MTKNEPEQFDVTTSRILAAIVRVLAGRPTTAVPGDLTITAVAAEAQLKRHYLTHKHTDLKELFYQLREHHNNPVREHSAVLAKDIDKLNEKLTEAREETAKWKTTAHTFARAINVLTLENHQLREQPSNVRRLTPSDR
jgi:hypothetical protein